MFYLIHSHFLTYQTYQEICPLHFWKLLREVNFVLLILDNFLELYLGQYPLKYLMNKNIAKHVPTIIEYLMIFFYKSEIVKNNSPIIIGSGGWLNKIKYS